MYVGRDHTTYLRDGVISPEAGIVQRCVTVLIDGIDIGFIMQQL